MVGLYYYLLPWPRNLLSYDQIGRVAVFIRYAGLIRQKRFKLITFPFIIDNNMFANDVTKFE